MSWASDLSATLDKGLHTDNLNEIADAARTAIAVPATSVAAFVVEQIARNLCDFWDGDPDSDKHNAAEAKLIPPLKTVAEAVSRDAAEAEVWAALTRAIAAYQVVVTNRL